MLVLCYVLALGTSALPTPILMHLLYIQMGVDSSIDPSLLEVWEWECEKRHTPPEKVAQSITIWIHRDRNKLKQNVCEIMSRHDDYRASMQTDFI
jgi:hypothetical protein